MLCVWEMRLALKINFVNKEWFFCPLGSFMINSFDSTVYSPFASHKSSSIATNASIKIIVMLKVKFELFQVDT